MTLRVERIRPGPAAEAWLDGVLAEFKAGDPLAPVTVIVPSNYAGLALRRRLAVRGFANVRHTVLARLAESLGAPALAARGKVPLMAVTEEAAIRAALKEAGGLGDQSDHRAVVVTLRNLFRDLAEGEVDSARRASLAQGGELTRIAIRSYEAYRELLQRERLYDATDLLAAATEAVSGGEAQRVLADWGRLLLHLPDRLSSADLGLLRALAETAGLAERFTAPEVLRRIQRLEELRDNLARNIQEALAFEVAFLEVFGS